MARSEAFWSFRNALEGEDNEPVMELYGYISEYSWLDDDVTPKMFRDDLWFYGNGGPITVKRNSAGGDLIAASVMRSVLVDYPGRVTVRVDGLAASAATLVAIAGDRVMMHESAYFMIHDPIAAFFMAALNIQELERLLASMKTAKTGIMDAYESRTGASRERLARWMTAETWFTAREAVTNGFADEVITAGKAAAVRTEPALVNAS